jgi:hypothetical protein
MFLRRRPHDRNQGINPMQGPAKDGSGRRKLCYAVRSGHSKSFRCLPMNKSIVATLAFKYRICGSNRDEYPCEFCDWSPDPINPDPFAVENEQRVRMPWLAGAPRPRASPCLSRAPGPSPRRTSCPSCARGRASTGARRRPGARATCRLPAGRKGCTEAVLLAHGFTIEQLVVYAPASRLPLHNA